ncbi:HsdM family class I SAM-dependent methyltransferase [Glaesserella parasuis]|uniref:HsdM family class I SAM-dependent methyltransferase n=1 Tax=Glaesserella parasuis TaxID=738 RepID=UPI00271E8D24|nr:N-6 DNA methylase [Glaesserella parasuis]MDO9802302.1 N-6 DNA methylase [Glaesserella parasuis]MDO9880891.1 N-6 DNA methylase [Glaesserella parasuis]
MNFSEFKAKFDQENINTIEYDCFLPVHLTYNKKTTFKKKDGTTNEEFYKWQFLYSLVNSGLVPKDYIGTEIHFPKGNKSSAPIKIDGAIFDDKKWFEYYKNYHQNGDIDSLEWLREHLIAAIEFKKEDKKNIPEVWDKQLKAYLRESDRKFCLGILYDTGRLYLFKKHNNKLLRFSDEYNTKGEDSKTKDLCLHLTDPYLNIPSFQYLLDIENLKEKDLSSRTIFDLDIISGVHSTQINDVMSNILRTMDKVGLTNQRGFEILIQILSLKIFDEKRNEKNNNRYLDFYITPSEKKYESLADENVQKLIERTNQLRDDASGAYTRILKNNVFNSKNENHVKVLIEVISQFQNYSFVRSHKTDLYQLVFYKFATPFSKENNAQFVTPLPLIDFLVKIVNPRNGETVIDPTVGIADFLSVSYVNSNSKLDDGNIFGMDIDEQMVMLATLNMLLNGDGNAKIEAKSGYGSLLSKFDNEGGILELIPSMNKNGNWDNRPDEKKLKKFDVVLTNPPFGEDRAFTPKKDNDTDKAIIECYELWNLYSNKGDDNSDTGGKKKSSKKQATKIDLGVIFLENAYRILKGGGRMGIVLSNSIASIDSHKIARQWLMDKMRIVAIFDLPANVFAETGVNTSIIVAYKPTADELDKLKEQNYQVFAKDIQKVGYEVKTNKRVKQFVPTYKMDYKTFEVQIDNGGNPMLDEDFTQTITDFKQWCVSQEQVLQDMFIKAK